MAGAHGGEAGIVPAGRQDEDVRWTRRPDLVAALDGLRDAADRPGGHPHPAEAYIFGTKIGTQIRSVTIAWRRACKRAGISGLHFHDLRREAGSRWLEGGVQLHTVRDWLGHSSIEQTSTYLKNTVQH